MRAFPTRTAESPPEIPDYELLRRVGRGAYGEVWLARSVLGQWRAVKLISRGQFNDARPFDREFEGIKRFEPISRSHPSQLAILHVGKNVQAGCLYYVMELADSIGSPKAGVTDPKQLGAPTAESDGTSQKIPKVGFELGSDFRLRASDSYLPHTLRHDLEQRGRLPISDCVPIGLSLATALGHLHTHGLVHRDIKPSNVLFVNGVPKLGDIGLVAEAGDTQSIVGTEGYISPEGPGTPQADIFSLGIVLYEISTGMDRRRFSELPEDLREWADRGEVVEFNEILLKACAKDPAQRYQSAEEMQADLELLRGGKSIRRKRTLQRRWAWSKKAALAMVLVSIVVTASLIATNGFDRRAAAVKSTGTTFETSGTKNRAAYNAYSVGRFYWNKRTADGLSNAIVEFSTAIRLDTNFARAYAGLADSYNVVDAYGGASPEETRPAARAAALEAVRLDPTLAEGHASLAKLRFEQDWDWPGAEQEFRKALQLNRNYALAHHWYANYLAAMNRLEEAIREARRAVELEPTSLIFNTTLGLNLRYARDYEGALEQCREIVAMDPNFVPAHMLFGDTYQLLGRPAEAAAEWERLSLLLGENPDKIAARRVAFQAGGIEGYWRTEKEQLKEEFAGQPPPSIRMARLCARLGEVDEAFAWLDRAFSERRHYLKYLNVDPVFDPLRSDPRFHALLNKMHLP